MNDETIAKMKEEKEIHQKKVKKLVVELLHRDSMSNFERKRKGINETLGVKIPSCHYFRKDREPVQWFQYKPKDDVTDNSLANFSEVVDMFASSSLPDIVDIVPDETNSSWLDQYYFNLTK